MTKKTPGTRRDRGSDDDPGKRLEDFASASSGWFWEMDAQLRFTYMSRSVQDVTGVPPEWHYGKSRADIGIPSSVSEESWHAHLTQLEQRQPFNNFVFQRSGPDGEKWMQTSGVPIFDAAGRFTGYRGIATDVTARVVAEQRARRLEEAIENLNDLFVLWDENDKLLMCNARFRAMNSAVADTTRPGTGFEDHIRAAMAAGLYPEAAGHEEPGHEEQWIGERLAQHRNPGKPFVLERQDGRAILVSEHRLPDGSTATISTDITEHRRAQHSLAEQHRILQAALRAIPDGVQVLDDELRLVAWNEKLFEVMDLHRDAILGAENPGDAFRYALAARGEYGPGEIEELVESRKTIARSPVPVRYERQLVNGKWIECRGHPVEGGGYVAIYRDVDESKRLREELERQATVDALTGLLNRRRFLERAEEELRRANRYQSDLCVLVLDVDEFKAVNDNHGHIVGDEVLRQIATTCREQIRETDLLGRIGGEEFSAVLPETSGHNAFMLAERLRRAVEALRISISGGFLKLTLSIGVGELHDRHGSTEALIAEADFALYEAKRGGRNRVGWRDLRVPPCSATHSNSRLATRSG